MFKRNIFIVFVLFILMKAIEYSLSYIFDYLNLKKYVNQILTIKNFNVFDITIFNINYQITILELSVLIILILYFLVYKFIKIFFYKILLQKNNYLANLDLQKQFNLINKYKATVQISCYDYKLAIKTIELYSHQQHKYTTFILLDDFIDSKIDKVFDSIIEKLHLPIKTKFELLTNQILYKIIDNDIYVPNTEKFKKLININNLSIQGIIFLLNDKSQLKDNSNIDKLLNILMENSGNIKPNIFLIIKNSIYNLHKDNIIYLQGLTFKQSTHHFFSIFKKNLKNNIAIEDKYNNIIIKNEYFVYNNNKYKFEDIANKLNKYDNYTSQKFIRNSNAIIDEYEIVIAYLYKIYIMHYGYPNIYIPFIKQIINDKKIDSIKELYIKSKNFPKVPAGVFYHSDNFSLPNYNNNLHNILIELDFFKINDNKIELNEEYLTFNNYHIYLTEQGAGKINTLYSYFLNNIIINNNEKIEIYDIEDEYFDSLKIKDENITYKKLQNDTYLFNLGYFIIEKYDTINSPPSTMITIKSNNDTYHYENIYINQSLNNDISISTLSLETISILENFNNEYLIELMCILGIVFKVSDNQYYLNKDDIDDISKVFFYNINKALKTSLQYIKHINYRINKNHLNKLLNLNLIYPIGRNLYMPLDILHINNNDKLRYLLYLKKNEKMEKIYHYIEKYINDKNIKYKIGYNQLKILSQIFENNLFFKKQTIEKLFNNRLYQYASNMPYAYFMYNKKYGKFCSGKEIEIYKLYVIKDIFNEKQLHGMYNSNFISNKYNVNQYLSYILTIERLLSNKQNYNKVTKLFKKEILANIHALSSELIIGFNFIEDKGLIDEILNSISSNHSIYFKYIVQIRKIIAENRTDDIKDIINKLENLPTEYLENFNFKKDYIEYVKEDFDYNKTNLSWFGSAYLKNYITNQRREQDTQASF